ncbi:MAG TPA: hypothetical protein VFZ40_02885 [Pyrinomonadaceae bacterium]
MFVGHYAVGLAAKRFAPRTSLGILIAAPILLDLIWPILVLVGWEHVSIVDSRNPFLRLQFDSYPISHGLLAVVGWATLFASIYFGLARYLAGAITVWLGVISHWLLDYVVHRPDLPLYAGSNLLGLGLWNRRWITVAVELTLLAAGVAIYLVQTRAKDRIGSFGFWAFVFVIVALYGAVVFGPAPPSVNKLAIAALSNLLFVGFAWWFDSHRETYGTANGGERVQHSS